MDLATAIGSLFAAIGLSGAAGLNAWIPLFTSALLDRVGAIELAAPFDQLTSTPALVLLGVALVLDFVGDKVPGVDHVLHITGAIVHPLAGAVVFAGQTGLHTGLSPGLAALAGAVVAGSLHAGRATVRPASTATTAGVGNPVLSLLEDGVSVGLTALAFLLPVLALAVVVAIAIAIVAGWRRLRSRRAPALPPHG